MDAIEPMKKIKSNPTVAGAGIGVLLAWAWNGFYPDYKMPAEVAAGAAPLLGHVVRWLIAWLPEPR